MEHDSTIGWPELCALVADTPLAPGYRLEMLTRDDVDALVDGLGAWYPDIGVGAASCYLRASFYAESVAFADTPDRKVFVAAMHHGERLVGMFSWDCDRDTLSLYARLGVAAPAHRGAGLATAGLALVEAYGRRIGAGLVYGMATLKTRNVQAAFERAGWQLIGITPGYDRERVRSGAIKRVYEAVYTRVLVPPEHLLQPQPQDLTPATRAFFDRLFGRHRERAGWLAKREPFQCTADAA